MKKSSKTRVYARVIQSMSEAQGRCERRAGKTPKPHNYLKQKLHTLKVDAKIIKKPGESNPGNNNSQKLTNIEAIPALHVSAAQYSFYCNGPYTCSLTYELWPMT